MFLVEMLTTLRQLKHKTTMPNSFVRGHQPQGSDNKAFFYQLIFFVNVHLKSKISCQINACGVEIKTFSKILPEMYLSGGRE